MKATVVQSCHLLHILHIDLEILGDAIKYTVKHSLA